MFYLPLQTGATTKMSNVYLVDIDGTVATIDPQVNRKPYLYDMVGTDLPNQPVIDVVASLWRDGNKIIFLTGRDASAYDDTYNWLVRYCPPFIKLYTRAAGDRRPDNVVKREIYENQIKPHYNVVGVFEDRDRVVKMWREIGLTCFQVAEGDF